MKGFWTASGFFLTFFLLTGAGFAQTNPTQTFLATLEQAQNATHRQNWPEAVRSWQTIVHLNPVEGRFWVRLGEAYFHSQDYAAARHAYQKAFALGAENPSGLAYMLARCAALLHDRTATLAWLEKAFALGFPAIRQARTEPAFGWLRAEARFRRLTGPEVQASRNRIAGWQSDLRFLVQEVKRRRVQFTNEFSATEFERAARRLQGALPHLTDLQIIVEMMKLMRRVGDGHSLLYGFWERPEFLQTIPIDAFFFAEGLFITAAEARWHHLLGAQILRLGDHAPEAILTRLDPLISRDNQMAPFVMGWMRMRNLPLLHALGLIPFPDRVTMTVRTVQGQVISVELPADSAIPSRKLWEGLPSGWKAFHSQEPAALPAYLKDNQANYWFEYLAPAKTVYFQFNRVQHSPQESLTAFAERLFRFISEQEVQKLVIDLRWNAGGDTTLEPPLLAEVLRCRKINQRGKLFVIIGRRTFSAAQNWATLLERLTPAIFVGEPTGSSPNFIGEEVPFELPYSKIMANVSHLFWQTSWPWDRRTWIAPLLYTPPTFAAYQAGRDPALEAILAFPAPHPHPQE
ncbi:MAG: hypothetical protein K1Y36_10555 [Blastocatellia bacterium]|nr:hypothetical protein [Blastocatellia bacterium]